jgi:hypothetical protein
MVRSPNPKTSLFGLGISVIASAVIPGLPILIVNSFLVATIATLLSDPAVENGKLANAPIPNNIYNPLKETVRYVVESLSPSNTYIIV